MTDPTSADQPTTEELLEEAQRMYAYLVDASARLAAFTELLRAVLRALPPPKKAATDA